MKKKKYSTKQKITYLISSVVIVLIFVFIDKYQDYNKEKELNKNSFKTYALVEKIIETTRKSGKYNRKRENVIYFGFTKGDTIFHKIKRFPNYFAEKKFIGIGDIFYVRVSTSDYDMFEIDFTKKIDTSFNKSDYHHIYETERHRKIIE